MLGPSSNPRPGVFCLALLTASLLSFGSAASADWLVTNEGAAVETRGPWEVQGKMVVFTSPTGVLSSLPLTEVNLVASEAQTLEAATPASSHQEAESEVKRQAVMVLTDADVRHVATNAPADEEAEGNGETSTAAPAPRDSGSSLAVTEWEESYNVEENSVEVAGSLHNSGRNPATSISLNVLLYSDSGTLLGKREARLVKAALNPGESTGFVASFSSGLTFSDAKFDIQSRGFRAHEAASEDGEAGEIEPEGI